MQSKAAAGSWPHSTLCWPLWCVRGHLPARSGAAGDDCPPGVVPRHHAELHPPIIHVIVRLMCVHYLSTPGIAPPVTALKGQVTVTSRPGSLAGWTREHGCPKAACFPAAGLMVR